MTDMEIEEEPLLPPLLTMGDARLAQASAPVPEGLIRAPEFQQHLRTLRECMQAYMGIGIAAPQIGWGR